MKALLRNKMAPNFIFIESNTTGTGQLFLKKAKELGFNVIFLTKNPDKYPFLYEELIHPVIIDTESYSKILQYLKTIKDIKAISSTSEFFIEVASKVAKQLGLPHNQPSAIYTCRNKDILYKKLTKAGISVPLSFAVKNHAEALDTFKQLTFPLIVKPRNGSGSLGVKLCFNKKEALEHTTFLLTQETSLLPNKNSAIIIQEFIKGPEFSVETISLKKSHHIIGITKKYLGTPPYFIETGHDFPAICNSKEEEAIFSTVKKALHDVHFIFGPSHIELRLHNATPYIIEINPRLAGGMIPLLIKTAKGIDLITQIINLYIGKDINLIPNKNNFSSIRFFVAEQSGVINKLKSNYKDISNIFQYKALKEEGENLTIHGDYRDRVAYVIACHKNPEESIQFANNFINQIEFEIKPIENITYDYTDTGILKETLHHEAMKIIKKPLVSSFESKLIEYNSLTIVDEAHLLMLAKCKIISKKDLEVILKEIQKLKSERFFSLIIQKDERGAYLLYERELIRRLGIKIAGKIHSARSRNDLYETIFRLSLRSKFENVYKSLWKLRSKILNLSYSTQDLPFPIYSQYQPALPSTFSHYLLGIQEALFRDQIALQNLYDFLNLSPLGCGASGGTSFPIQPFFSAKLLGFDNCLENSLDAIASKDIALKFLSTISILGITLSRIIEDLQLWSTYEVNFIFFPDNLLGGSSMMPQKKNPYLLEEIKTKIDLLLGNLTASIASVLKTPFSNSYETKSTIIHSIEDASLLIIDALDLTRIIINNIKFNRENIIENLKKSLVVSTYISECLSREAFAIKEAHKVVGNTIFESIKNKEDPLKHILSLIPKRSAKISENPLDWAHANKYGGGPGKDQTIHVLTKGAYQLYKDSQWWSKKESHLKKAEHLRNKLIKQLLHPLQADNMTENG